MADVEQGIDWAAITKALAAPFAPEAVQWLIQGKPAPNKRVLLLPYVDARDVQDRLDEACPGAWSFTLEPLVVDAGELRVARGRLTIHGIARDDIGAASNIEASKGCASDALKRAGVMWSISRYLYRLPDVWCQLDADGKIPDAMRAKLRERLAAAIRAA